MAGRPRKPETNYKVALRRTGKYRYAATQPAFIDSKTGKEKRRYIYWGEVTDDNRFIPNERYRLASREERDKLIFPKNWDLSEIDRTRNADLKSDIPADPYISNDGSAFTGTVTTCPAEGQYNNRFYGGTFFLWEIAVRKNVIEDLLSVFDGDQTVVNDIMTLAMFPILEKWNYSQTERWQRYTMTPSVHPLSPSFITRFTQNIHDSHRMNFLKLRIRRQSGKALVACDSTTRSAYGRCLADIRWGNNKDNDALQNTLEVVVYSIDTHEPIYYRTFAGNESDSRTLRTIISDLKELGCQNLTVIFDRGYETEENIDEMIRHRQSFLVCSRVGRRPVYDEIIKLRYDSEGIPSDMDYDPDTGLYHIQTHISRTITANDDDSSATADINVNLFLDMTRRIRELIELREEMRFEEKIADRYVGQPCSSERMKELKKLCPYFKVSCDKDGFLVAVPNEKKITKVKATAGFFSSLSYEVEGNAIRQYEYYKLRDEQEKYFESMKDQLGFSLQRNWSEDGKTGRLFILFVGLIMQSEIRSVWERELKNEYPSSVDVLHEMVPIRFVEYENGRTHVTGFTRKQAHICQIFGIPIPEDCLSESQKAAIDRAKAHRGRGRPKGSVNRKKVVAQL